MIDKSKLLLKMMSDKSMKPQRYKTEYDENKIADTQANKSNKSLNHGEQHSFLRQSLGKRPQNTQHSSRMTKFQVSQLLKPECSLN